MCIAMISERTLWTRTEAHGEGSLRMTGAAAPKTAASAVAHSAIVPIAANPFNRLPIHPPNEVKFRLPLAGTHAKFPFTKFVGWGLLDEALPPEKRVAFSISPQGEGQIF
jgi:hypothetical protein